MDAYFVVECRYPNCPTLGPDFYESKSEAIDAAKKLHEKNPDKSYDVWRAEIIIQLGV